MADPTLTFDFTRAFPGGPAFQVRDAIPLTPGTVTVLFGPSGSGKTTVLRALAGFERPDAGTIRFGDETWFDGAAGTHLPPQRRGVGVLFQDYALFPHLTVAGNLGYGLRGHARAARHDRVREVARTLGLEALLHRRPHQLSGGQRQRVALARALVPRPRLLLLDEPLSALDAPTREALRGELRRLLHASGTPAVVVTHDRIEALTLGDRIAVLADGQVRQTGPVHAVFGHPTDVTVARVVGTENVIPVRVEQSEGGLVTAAAGTLRLVGLDPGAHPLAPGDGAYACVRAEEIVLEPRPAARTSARNLLPVTVVALVPEGPMMRVRLSCCGTELVALITRRSAEELALAPGAALAALVKAPSVRLVPREDGGA